MKVIRVEVATDKEGAGEMSPDQEPWPPRVSAGGRGAKRLK